MDINNVRFESSLGRLSAMETSVIGYQTAEDVLLDLARHALCISVNAKIAQFSSDAKADWLCKMACDFQCHYDKIARRLQIKNSPVIVVDVSCCDFQYEGSIEPQLIGLITVMKACLSSGFSAFTEIGDKSVIGEIAACLDEDLYCLTECMTDPAS